MNYEEFRERAAEIIGYPIYEDKLSISWTVGGITGGSCYGDAPNQAVSPEEEPEFTALDTLLDAFAPSISYQMYRRLMRECQESGIKQSGGDFYGNYYESAEKTVHLSRLFQFLTEHSLLVEPPRPEPAKSTRARKGRARA